MAIAKYAAWLFVCLVAMEILTHAAPAMAVAGSGAYSDFLPLQLMMFCFVLLKLMWLKFSIIWRFFRLWALLDGVETPVRHHLTLAASGGIINTIVLMRMSAGEYVAVDDR